MTDPAGPSSATAEQVSGAADGPASTGGSRPDAVALVVAPLVFVAGWAVAGASIEGYSPVRLAISDLAGVDSSTRWQMTAVLVAYGLAMVIGAAALRRASANGAAVAAVVNGVATMAVAATPVHGSDTVDSLHGIAAFVSYVSLAALPIAAAVALARSGQRVAAVVSVVTGVAVALAFAGANGNERTGLFQRVGTSLGNAWTLAAGVALLVGAFGASRSRV